MSGAGNQTLISSLCRDLDGTLATLNGFRPLGPAAAAALADLYRVPLTYHSNAIEGNTLTYNETRAVLETGVTIGGKSVREHLEVTNHAKAIGRLEAMAGTSSDEITTAEVTELHALVLRSIDDENAGRYRTTQAQVIRADGSPRLFANPASIASKMERAVADIASRLAAGGHAARVAALAHYDLVAIHPFADGNGRTARLLMNLILLRHGYQPAVLLVENRAHYLDALEAADQGDLAAFEILVLEAALRSMRQAIDLLEAYRA